MNYQTLRTVHLQENNVLASALASKNQGSQILHGKYERQGFDECQHNEYTGRRQGSKKPIADLKGVISKFYRVTNSDYKAKKSLYK